MGTVWAICKLMLDIPNIHVKSICGRAEVHSNKSHVYSLNKTQENGKKMQNCEGLMYFFLGFGRSTIINRTARPAQSK